MITEKKITADVALASSAAFVVVPDPNASMGFQAPNLLTVAEIYVEGTVSVTFVGERLDLDIFLKKDSNPTGDFLSSMDDKFVTGQAAKADGIKGAEAHVAGNLMELSLKRRLVLPEGNYKMEVRYKTSGGSAAIIEGGNHDLRFGIHFTRHVALLPQAVKPQFQLQV